MEMHVVDAEYLKEIDKARQDLRALIFNKQCAHLMLRLAWHDAATYDEHSKTGGPNGSIRKQDVYSRESNNGLKVAIDYCEEIRSKHLKITYADLYQLAGVVAIEIIGGPSIDFVPGRKDSNISPKDGLLPCLKEDTRELRARCTALGLYGSDIPALLAAHTLEIAHADNEPLKFDNSYYVELFEKESAGLLKHPLDLTLLTERWFRYRARMYAKNEEIFFEDYAKAHKKFSELGFTRRTSRPCKANNRSRAIWVAIVVVTLGYVYKSRKK